MTKYRYYRYANRLTDAEQKQKRFLKNLKKLAVNLKFKKLGFSKNIYQKNLTATAVKKVHEGVRSARCRLVLYSRTLLILYSVVVFFKYKN